MPPNPALGFKFLTKASEAGEIDANDALALCYENGLHVDKRSPTLAFELWNHLTNMED